MNTVLFSAARHAVERRDFPSLLKGIDPAQRFPFQDEISRENYLKELRGEPLPPVPNPLVIVTSNVPGTGKSMLVKSLISARFGIHPDQICASKSYRNNERRLRKEIEAAIVSGREYLWFDDWSGSLCSESLAFFPTVSSCSIRMLGSQSVRQFPVNLRIYLSGNQLDFPEDLVRRSRVIGLFMKVADWLKS